MTIEEYISQQPEDRQQILSELHEAIINHDKTITPVIEPMMGKEMIIYKERCYMKYGLSSIKNYMSLHCMPIYGSPALHTKYLNMLPLAKFQKGCINFTNKQALPVNIAGMLFADCAKISIADMIENWKKRKK